MVAALFQRWNLSDEQQLGLLGPRWRDVGDLLAFRDAECSLPGSPDCAARIGHLMAIHRALRLLFPENEDLRFSWARRRNQVFNGAVPIEIMLKEGAPGIARVAAVLDQQCRL